VAVHCRSWAANQVVQSIQQSRDWSQRDLIPDINALAVSVRDGRCGGSIARDFLIFL